MERTDIVLSAEDVKTVEKLAKDIADCLAIAADERLVANVRAASNALEAAEAAFEATMLEYEYFFDVPAEQRLDASAYNRDTYHGAVYKDKDGKYVIGREGKIDAEGNEISSPYTVNDKSVVKVGYDNGVEFYLNYNYFDVLVEIDGEKVLIGAYSFYKKG